MNKKVIGQACARSTTAVALIFAIALSAGCGKSEEQSHKRPTPQVSVMTVAPQTIPFTPSYVAQTVSSQQVNIVARVSGFLDQIAYQEGALVKEGQLLFQLDPKPFQVKLQAAEGELQAQQARFATAKANLDRTRPLAELNALSKADLDKAQGEYDSSKAAVYSAQAKVAEARLNLGYTTIRSPVTGLAGSALQRQGAYINAQGQSAELTYVAKIDPMWVDFSISQNQVSRYQDEVAKGLMVQAKNKDYQVEITLPDGQVVPHLGSINFADPSYSQETGTFLVRAVIPNPKRDLRPGMFVTARVKGAVRPNAIVVPQLAVQQGAKGHMVYVVNAAGIAEIRPVVVGDYHGEKDIVILAGLHGGDRVVVDGVMKVVPGQPVHIVQPGSRPAAAGAAAPRAGAAHN